VNAAFERTLDRLLETARAAHAELTGVTEVCRRDVYVPADPWEHFGLRDAIGAVIKGAGEVIGVPGEDAGLVADSLVASELAISGVMQLGLVTSTATAIIRPPSCSSPPWPKPRQRKR
jgi:hypothetical protein